MAHTIQNYTRKKLEKLGKNLELSRNFSPGFDLCARREKHNGPYPVYYIINFKTTLKKKTKI